MTRPDIDKLRADIAAILNEDPASIGDDDNLSDLGLDSMRVMALLMQWEAEGIAIEFAELADSTTLAGWWARIGHSA